MGERNEGKDWEKKRIDQRRGKGEGRERGEKEEEERGTEEKIDLKERKGILGEKGDRRRGVLGRGEEEQDRRVILGRIEKWEIDQKNR